MKVVKRLYSALSGFMSKIGAFSSKLALLPILFWLFYNVLVCKCICWYEVRKGKFLYVPIEKAMLTFK